MKTGSRMDEVFCNSAKESSPSIAFWSSLCFKALDCPFLNSAFIFPSRSPTNFLLSLMGI